MGAAAVIVTVGSEADIDEIVNQVRALRTDILIISRARDAAHARHLYPERTDKSKLAVKDRKRASLFFQKLIEQLQLG
jgi:hypothetical protein